MLADVNDAAGVSFAPACKITVDLNGHELLFTKNLKNKTTGAIVGKAKCFQFTQSDGSIEIKNGTIGVANTTTDTFERLIRSYVNLTLTDVTLDGTNVRDQDTTPDGALLCHTLGILTLDGTTNIITKPDANGETYYAVSGKLANTVSPDSGINYSGGFSINVDVNGEIPSLALYGWHNGNSYDLNLVDSSDGNFSRAHISIASGEIGKIALSNIARSLGGANQISITGGTFGTFDYTNTTDTPLFVYGGNPTDTTRNVGAWVLGAKGWNAASTDSSNTEYNYITAESSGTSTPGTVVVNVKGVTDKEALALDEKNKTFGVPSNVTASLVGGDSNNYKVAYVSYNNAKDAVTISSATSDAVISAADTKGILANTAKTIDAKDVTVAASIIGNTLNNEIYGGTGNQNLTLGDGSDTYVYSGGQDVVADYRASRNGDKDIIRLSGITPITDGTNVTVSGEDLVLDFGSDNKLTFTGIVSNSKLAENANETLVASKAAAENGAGVTVLSGNNANNNTYVYRKSSIAHLNNGVTLTSGFTASSYSPENTYYTINGSAVNHALNITGDNYNNYIIGSDQGGTLYGATGNDNLFGSASANDIFVYTNGKDTVENYKSGDAVSLGAAVNIASGKYSSGNLIFTIDKSNTLTLKDVDETAKITLSDGSVLTKAGKVASDKLTLFKDSKGRIDADALEATAGVNASAVTNKITLSAATGEGGEYTFAANRKNDVFEYNGGQNIALSGYESGKDKVNLYDAFKGFTVGTGNDKNVTLQIDASNTLVLEDAKDKEINLNNGGKRYSKMIFSQSGVIKDKASNATSVTLYSGVADKTYDAANDSKVKKINFADGVGAMTVTGNGQNNVIDASDFGTANDTGFKIGGGAGNDKITGSKGKDTFVYTAGKDVISGFGSGDSISLGSGLDLKTAKINASSNKKSVSIKFSGKNALNIKGDSALQSISFNGTDYTLGKNWLMSSGNGAEVSLTSNYGGTFKVKESDVKVINGSTVKKSLTFTGTGVNETLIGGTNKTKFKGGGGADSLVGGTGTDTFFYAKGNTGDAVIAGFEKNKDKLKVASGILTGISKEGNLKLTMSDGKKNGNSSAGSFTLQNIASDKALLKANNTYYWFEEGTFTDSDGNDRSGAWVTSLGKVSSTAAKGASGYSIVDLGYSTNLVKAGLAYKSSEVSFSSSGKANTHTATTTEG